MVVEVVLEDLALRVEARPKDPMCAPRWADADAEDSDDDVMKDVVAAWEEEEAPPRDDDDDEESAATPVVVTLETPEAPFPLKCVTSVPFVVFTEVKRGESYEFSV